MTAETLTREQWLAKRRESIQASEWANILGVGRDSALAVYEAKTTDNIALADNDWLRFGRDVEGAIAQMYAAKTGRTVRDLGATTITVHPEIPYLGATLDRETEASEECPGPDGPAPLELKHVSRFDISANEWSEDPPLMYQIQVQAQMACSGAAWGSLAGMFPGYQLAWVDLPRDDGFIAAALPVLAEFWERVQRRDPPPPTGPRCLDAVKRLYSAETGETVTLDPAMLDVADKWDVAKAAGREAEVVKKECEAKIRAEIGSATFGDLGDGTLLVRSTSVVKAHTRAESTRHLLRRTRLKNM